MLPKPNPSVLFQRLPEGAVLLDAEREIYFGLNAVGAQIWHLLPPLSDDLASVCEALGRDYPEVDRAELKADVTELLDVLLEQGLVVSEEGG